MAMTREYENIPRIKHADWLTEGQQLFGTNFADWRFVCPACGNVAAVKDFQQFKEKGADPSSAATECIGRYTGAGPRLTAEQKPCNWAAYGLFMICDRVVEFPDNTVGAVFNFEHV